MTPIEERAWRLAGDLLLEFEDMGLLVEPEDADAWGLARERLASVLLGCMVSQSTPEASPRVSVP